MSARSVSRNGAVGSADSRARSMRLVFSDRFEGSDQQKEPPITVYHSKSSDRFSRKLDNGRGVEGLRMGMNADQYRALQGVFEEAKAKLLSRRVCGIKFSFGEFKLVSLLGEPMHVGVEGAELTVEHMESANKYSRKEAEKVLFLMEREFRERVLGPKKRLDVDPEAAVEKLLRSSDTHEQMDLDLS